MIYIPKNKRRILFEKKDGKEELFLFLVEDLVCKTDLKKYPNSIFLFKNDLFYFKIYKKQDKKNGQIYCSHTHYWSIFENKFNLNYHEIQEFTKKMVEKHFKLKDLTPVREIFGKYRTVEKHFKLKDLTPPDPTVHPKGIGRKTF